MDDNASPSSPVVSDHRAHQAVLEDFIRAIETNSRPLQPLQLFFTYSSPWIGDVVQHDEMNAFVIEGVMKVAEKLLVCFTTIQRSIVFPRHKPHCLHVELAHNVAEFGHAVPAYLPIIRRLCEVAGEDNEIR